jgi:hypothetical protein
MVPLGLLSLAGPAALGEKPLSYRLCGEDKLGIEAVPFSEYPGGHYVLSKPPVYAFFYVCMSSIRPDNRKLALSMLSCVCVTTLPVQAGDSGSLKVTFTSKTAVNGYH